MITRFAKGGFNNAYAVEQNYNNKKINALQEEIGKLNGDYYVKEADQIMTKEGKVVDWSYWPERFYLPFMENVRKKLGIKIG